MSLRDDTFTANTKANKKLEPIPWGHHSSVPATRSGPRAVTPPASTSPYFSRSRARTRPSAFITSRRLAPGVGSEGGGKPMPHPYLYQWRRRRLRGCFVFGFFVAGVADPRAARYVKDKWIRSCWRAPRRTFL